MWFSAVMLVVTTKDADDAGTDSLITATIRRDGDDLVSLKLDWPAEDDLERGAKRAYTYFQLERHNDRTPVLGEDEGIDPPPYPGFGLEFSDGLQGHLQLVLRSKGPDMWIKDRVELFVLQTRMFGSNLDPVGWQDDPSWTFVAAWDQDVRISKEWLADLAHTSWTMGV